MCACNPAPARIVSSETNMNLTVLSLFLLAHFSLFAISVPLAKKKVRPNAIYGFRTPKTLSSEPIWYEANSTFGRLMMRTMVVTAGLQVLAALLLWGDRYPGVGTAILMVAVLVVVVRSFYRLSQL